MAKTKMHTPGTIVHYKKDWQKQPRHYMSLAFENLKDKDYAVIASAEIITGEAAEEFARSSTNWSFSWLYRHDVGVLRFKGVDIKGFYKRQTVALEFTELETPPSALAVKHMGDLWCSFDLTGTSERKKKEPQARYIKTLEDKVASLEKVVQASEKAIASYAEQLQELRAKKVPALSVKKPIRPTIRLGIKK